MAAVPFDDRVAAGEALAGTLAEEVELNDPVLLALPRGGVPVAYEIGRTLSVPLEVVVARKIGAPGQPELAVGAIAEDGEPVFDEQSLRWLGLNRADLASTVSAEREELARRRKAYRGDRRLPDLTNRDAVVVDDGLATGMTAIATLVALRDHQPGRLLLAVPVAAARSAARLREFADEFVAVHIDEHFQAVGAYYRDFSATSDAEVLDLLNRAQAGYTS